MVLAQLSTCLSSFHSPSIYYRFLVYTFNSSRYFFLLSFAYLPITGLTPALAMFLRTCFQRQLTFDNPEA